MVSPITYLQNSYRSNVEGVISSNSMKEASQSMEEANQSIEKASQSMAEANQSTEEQLASLREQVEKISEKISETHNDVAVQLRELISQRHDANDGKTTSTECSLPTLPSSTFSTTLDFNDNDSASIRSTSSSLPIRSVRSWSEELKNSRLYKRLWRHGVDSSSSSVCSKGSSAKGDTWSMLSDINLGDLSISEISVLELPISLSDLYDPIPYQQLTRHKQARRRINWSSRGSLRKAIDGDNIFTCRTLLSLGADPNEPDAYGSLLVHTASWEKVEFCRLLLD